MELQSNFVHSVFVRRGQDASIETHIVSAR